jgi:hypothetical protein
MINFFSRVLLCATIALGISCSTGNSRLSLSSSPNSPDLDSTVTDSLAFTLQSTRNLDADGEGSGLTAYDLIRAFAGSNPIESPDMYSLNHPEVDHIVEDWDREVGNHFVFKAHRDIDRDRDRYQTTDRQRNEIKTYNSSEDAVKGYQNETMVFSWKFKITEGMEVSTRFSHFFQLKAVGGQDTYPVVTFTGNERSDGDGLEVRYGNLQLQMDSILARTDWSEITGEWLDAYVRATFSDAGALRVILTRMSDSQVLFDIDETNIDMWRGTDNEHFVRPKWGIYRSLADADNLRPDEEKVRFANFRVSKVLVAE